MKIRASIGTATVLGLENILLQVKPTTAYLMLHSNQHCISNCSFCPQARESTSKSNKLSRVIWPTYDLSEITHRLKTNKILKRICIQTINFEESNAQIIAILEVLRKTGIRKPISLCSYPVSKEFMIELKKKGIGRIGISFDCATPDIFNQVKGINRGPTLSWAVLEEAMFDAMEVFGSRFVSTHLIIGLGETEREAIEFIQKFNDLKVTVGLFAFTPIRGTDLEGTEQPNISSYRRIQLGRYLIINDLLDASKMKFSKIDGDIIDFGVEKSKLIEIINSGKPFETSGCSHCNRPFYNESPGKTIYNFPASLSKEEITIIRESLKVYL